MGRSPRKWPKGMPRRMGVGHNRQLQKRALPTGLPEQLPLVHATAAWSATQIVKDGKIEARACDVFARNLIYFFVFRPAYRSKFGDAKSHQLTRFPVVFVLRPQAVPVPFHVYPFDTGGAAAGAFHDQADKLVPLEEYELAPNHQGAVGHIGWAFGSLEAYYDGHLRTDILNGIPEFESVTRGFIDVARMGREGSNTHDKRASTVELAASHDIDLKDNVLLAILPKQYIEGNTELLDMLRALGLKEEDIQFYDWQPNRAPDEFQRDIMDISRDWYSKRKIM